MNKLNVVKKIVLLLTLFMFFSCEMLGLIEDSNEQEVEQEVEQEEVIPTGGMYDVVDDYTIADYLDGTWVPEDSYTRDEMLIFDKRKTTVQEVYTNHAWYGTRTWTDPVRVENNIIYIERTSTNIIKYRIVSKPNEFEMKLQYIYSDGDSGFTKTWYKD